jgi:hypothetical protein
MATATQKFEVERISTPRSRQLFNSIAVSFPARYAADSIRLKNRLAYIREWIARERKTTGRNRSKSGRCSR